MSYPFLIVGMVTLGLAWSTGRMSAAPEPEVLMNVVQVRDLSVAEVQRELPAVIHGVVTYYDSAANLLFVQDLTGGIGVECKHLVPPGLRRGKYVQVLGLTGADRQTPVIRAHAAAVLSNAPPLAPKPSSIEQVATGQDDGLWISITGAVRSLLITPDQRMLTLEITDGKGAIRAHIPGFLTTNIPPAHWYQARVRLMGVAQAHSGAVATGIFAGKRRWEGDQLFVPSQKDVTVLQYAPLNVATKLIQPIKSVRELPRDDDAVPVVKVAGNITLASDEQRFYLQDSTGGLLVEGVGPPDAKPGQRVEVVGIPELNGSSLRLRQAQITHVSEGGPVIPIQTTVRETALGEWDGRLVRLEADVVASVPRRTPPHFLLLRSEDIIFEAQPDTLHPLPDLALLRPGSRVQLTGVCQVEGGKNLLPQGFVLRLRSVDDVVLLAQPPWWTVRRVLAALGSAIIVVLVWLLVSFRTEATLKEKYRRLFENASDLVCTLSPDGRFTALNKAGRTILGLAPAHTLPAKLEDLVPAEDRDRFFRWWGAVVAGQEPAPQEFRVGTADDRQFVMEISGQLWQPGGKPLEVICIGRDVTSRKVAEERRLALERKMLDAQKLESLGVLAGGIAHDFNNLLTVVLGNAALAQPTLPADSPARVHLEYIQKASLQAADLCKQMLAYSGKGRFLIQQVNLNTLIHEMWPLLEISVSKKATLEFTAASALPDLEADPSQLRQIVMNLVINASEALEDQPGLITIRTGRTTVGPDAPGRPHPSVPEVPAGDFVLLEVGDNGCGMTPETQAKIFDPFFTTKFVGRGLGLAAVLGIVRTHSGTLQIQSEPGRGSTFRILLPPGKSPAGRDVAATVAPAPDAVRGTVLLVDDHQGVILVATQMLQQAGFAVMTAADGEQAVMKFRRQASAISAVVLDLTMPQMGGEEAFEQIRLIKPEARVLLVSGFSEPEPGPRWTTEGRWAFLQKPFKPGDLIDALEHLLADTESSPAARLRA